jgi:hypothetical protein
MRRSEIFDAFVKIAQEKGMVSNDSKDAKKKLEQTGRADSLDISAIEALYGVKPDAPKSMDYKKNIMEVAHPNSVVVSPSHDKLNGLVETNNERQNILLHIVQKTPDGLSTHRKYAEQDFLLSLVKVANELDQKNEHELRKLADVCLEQSVKKNSIEKKAAVPVAAIAAVVAVIGVIWLQQHLPMVNDGFEKNHEKLVGELDDLLESNSSWQTTLGAGVEYKPQFLSEMQTFKTKLESFYTLTQSVMPIIEKMDKPKDGKQLMEVANTPSAKAAEEAYKKYREAYQDFLPYIKDVLKNFANEDYKLRQIQDKGVLTKIVDAPQVLHGGKGLVGDDFDDVKRALTTYRASLVDIATVLREAQGIQQKATTQLQQAAAETKKEMPDLDPNASSGAAPSGSTPAKQVDNKSDELADQLKQMGIPSGLLGG